jgi:hypothetical protein
MSVTPSAALSSCRSGTAWWATALPVWLYGPGVSREARAVQVDLVEWRVVRVLIRVAADAVEVHDALHRVDARRSHHAPGARRQRRLSCRHDVEVQCCQPERSDHQMKSPPVLMYRGAAISRNAFSTDSVRSVFTADRHGSISMSSRLRCRRSRRVSACGCCCPPASAAFSSAGPSTCRSALLRRRSPRTYDPQLLLGHVDLARHRVAVRHQRGTRLREHVDEVQLLHLALVLALHEEDLRVLGPRHVGTHARIAARGLPCCCCSFCSCWSSCCWLLLRLRGVAEAEAVVALAIAGDLDGVAAWRPRRSTGCARARTRTPCCPARSCGSPAWHPRRHRIDRHRPRPHDRRRHHPADALRHRGSSRGWHATGCSAPTTSRSADCSCTASNRPRTGCSCGPW